MLATSQLLYADVDAAQNVLSLSVSAIYLIFEETQTQISNYKNKLLSRIIDFAIDYVVLILTAAMLLAVFVLLVVLRD